MAGPIRIAIVADAKQAQKALSDVEKDAKQFDQEVSKATRSITAMQKAMNALEPDSSGYQTMERRIKGARDELTKLYAMRDTKVKVEVDVDTDQAGSSVKTFLRTAMSAIADVGAKIPQALGGAFSAGGPQVQAVVGGAILAGVAAAAPLAAGILAAGLLLGLGGTVLTAGIISAFKDPSVKSAFKDLGKQAQGIFTGIGKHFVGPLKTVKGIFSDTLKDIAPAIDRMAKAIAPALAPLAEGIGGFVEEAMPGLEAAVKASKPLFDALAKELPGVGKAVGDVFAMIASHAPAIMTAFKDAFAIIKALIYVFGATLVWLAGQWVVLRTSAIFVFKQLVGFFKYVWGQIVSYFKIGMAIIKGIWSGIKFLWTVIKSVLGAVLSVVSSAFNWIRNTIANGIAAWKKIWAGVGWLYDKIRTVTTSIRTAIGGVVSWIGTKLGSLVGMFRRIGDSIIEGFGRAFENSVNWIKGKISAIINVLPKAAKKLLGIGSPSKVFYDIGMDTVAGLQKGLDTAKSDKLLKPIQKAMSGTIDIAPTLGSVKLAGGTTAAVGTAGGAAGQPININITVPPNADQAAIGRATVKAINEYFTAIGRNTLVVP